MPAKVSFIGADALNGFRERKAPLRVCEVTRSNVQFAFAL
jgi:hypothetical protein